MNSRLSLISAGATHDGWSFILLATSFGERRQTVSHRSMVSHSAEAFWRSLTVHPTNFLAASFLQVVLPRFLLTCSDAPVSEKSEVEGEINCYDSRLEVRNKTRVC